MIRALAPSMPCSARRPRPRPCSSGACSRSATPFAGPTSAGAKLQACRSAFGIRTVNAVRLQLHALAYNLANFLRTLALPEAVKHWSLTTLRDWLVKIGAKIARHGRSVAFQMAEVMVPRALFQQILDAIAALRPEAPRRR
jgi:hypothetical protein